MGCRNNRNYDTDEFGFFGNDFAGRNYNGRSGRGGNGNRCRNWNNGGYNGQYNRNNQAILVNNGDAEFVTMRFGGNVPVYFIEDDDCGCIYK